MLYTERVTFGFAIRFGVLALIAGTVACAGEDGASDSDLTADAGPRFECSKTAHIGDSLTAYTIPTLTNEYKAHGVTDLVLSAGGGRSVFQKVTPDTETGKVAAARIRSSGFKGCWVVALGTNDTANIAAGANYSRAAAIDQMMTTIDETKKAPVMWVNTFTIKTSGYWDNENMILWNKALDDAKARWPNLRVYDWASKAKGGTAPYVDGIHHTKAGYAVRNKAIAEALVTFFTR